MTVTRAGVARGEIDHELIWGWVGLGGAAIAAWIITTVGVPPFVCPFRALTGLPCLTCGATRAVAALLAGQIAESLRLNPLVVAGAALASVYVPYAHFVVYTGRRRIRVCLSDRDWVLVRLFSVTIAAGLWTFLILDGR